MKRRIAVVMPLIVLFVLVSAAPAFGWGNGPADGQGFGSHDWFIYRGTQMAVANGVYWVDVETAMAASDDPDTIFHDAENHYLNGSPTYDGTAHERVEEFYDLAVVSLRAGDCRLASYYLGLLSHYYTDIGNPLHTADSPAEDSMHAAYEAAVDGILSYPGYRPPGYMDHWDASDWFIYVSDPYAYTEAKANLSRPNYADLVAYFSANGMTDTHSGLLTGVPISELPKNLSGIIRSIQVDATFTPQPNAVYRFYRSSTGTHFYSANDIEVARMLGGYPRGYSFDGVAYYADPDLNWDPLYRFLNKKTGTHLYTADESEKDRIRQTLSTTYRFEGVAYYVSSDEGAQVHRFFNPSKGVHFYSADPAEVAWVRANLGNIWRYEGPAYRVAQ